MIELRYQLSPWHVWRVSHYYKFAICCTPRCGSQSAMVWFASVNPPSPQNFLEDMEWLTDWQRAKVANEYLTLVLARDPWSRMVSAYLGKIVRHQKLLSAVRLIECVQSLLGQPIDVNRGITFRQFVYATRIFTDDHWRPIDEFVPFNPFMTATPDDLPAAIADLEKRCMMAHTDCPRINCLEYGPRLRDAFLMMPDDLRSLPSFPRWDSFYDGELRLEIAERYERDCRRFALSWEQVTDPFDAQQAKGTDHAAF